MMNDDSSDQFQTKLPEAFVYFYPPPWYLKKQKSYEVYIKKVGNKAIVVYKKSILCFNLIFYIFLLIILDIFFVS